MDIQLEQRHQSKGPPFLLTSSVTFGHIQGDCPSVGLVSRLSILMPWSTHLTMHCINCHNFITTKHTAFKKNIIIIWLHCSPEYSLEGLVLKLKLQSFGHLMGRPDSLEKTLILGKIEGRKRRRWQSMRWLNGNTNWCWTWVWASSGSWWWTEKEESEKVGLKLNIQKTKIMASGPITSWQIDGETVESVSDFIFLGSKITADGDCSHEIKRSLLLETKVMTKLDSILKSRDITLSPKSV